MYAFGGYILKDMKVCPGSFVSGETLILLASFSLLCSQEWEFVMLICLCFAFIDFYILPVINYVNYPYEEDLYVTLKMWILNRESLAECSKKTRNRVKWRFIAGNIPRGDGTK